jgi:hypothetical protein
MRPEHRLSLDESLECLPSPMEPHFDRVRGDREGQSGLVGIQFLDITQQEDGPVFLGKSLDAAPHHLARIATFENGLCSVGASYLIVDPLAVLVKAG